MMSFTATGMPLTSSRASAWSLVNARHRVEEFGLELEERSATLVHTIMPNWQIHVDEDVVRRDGQYIDRTRRNTFTLLALAGKWKRIWPAAEIEVGHFLLLSPALMHTPALQWQWQESPTAALSRWHSGNKLCVAVSASTRARSSTFGTRQARAGAAASCVRGLTDDHTWRMICMACSMQMGHCESPASNREQHSFRRARPHGKALECAVRFVPEP